MVLEATVVCIDNSDWMINGDYKPSRLQAQAEAVNLLAGAKTGSNPENTVGVLSLAGARGPKVLATPTPDLGRVLSCMQQIKPEGKVSLVAGVQIAQLALKHRQNKNQRQRIVAFIGSPLIEEERALVKVAKKLKKNNVSIDIVSFGDEGIQENGSKLEAFLSAVNSNETSHLVTVPPGSGALSDILLSTPVFTGDGESMPSAAGTAGGTSDFEFGVDPNLDPELALALRVSMEEERARQEAAAKAANETKSEDAPGAGSSKEAAEGTASEKPKEEEPSIPPVESAPDADGDIEMDDECVLQQALAMSLAVEPNADQLKTPEQGGSNAQAGAEGSSDINAMLEDKSFVTSVLSNLPGVDVSDANVQQVLSALKQQQSPSKKPEDDEEKKD